MSGLELIPLFGSLVGGVAASAPLDLLAAGAGAGAAGAAGGGISLGSALGIAGTGLSALGTIAGGAAAKASGDASAAQQEAAAKTERAKAQRQAFEQRRQSDLLSSRAQAVSAASGAGASSDAPSIVKIMTDIAGQGEQNAQTAMWNGEEQARSLEYGAKIARQSGRSSMLGSLLGAGATLGTGFAKYR